MKTWQSLLDLKFADFNYQSIHILVYSTYDAVGEVLMLLSFSSKKCLSDQRRIDLLLTEELRV